MDDRHLVDRMLRGDEHAFDEFFDQHFDRLFRFAVRRLGDPAAAEDVAQVTLVKSLRQLSTWRGEAALFTWLCAICRHEISAWTSRHNRVCVAVVEDDAGLRAVLDQLASTGETPEDEAGRRELAALIQNVLDHLPHRYGDILEWKYLRDWPVGQVAEKLGVSEKAAESLLTRARDAFRRGFASLSGAVVVCVCVALAAVGCTLPTTPADPDALGLSRSIATESFTFRHAAGDTVDAGWQEAFHRWAIAELNVTPPRRIVFNKYFSREHMRAQTGVGNTNAYADPDLYELHTIWPTDNHEVIHLYASAWGRPVALWSEGFAVSNQVDPVRNDMVPRWSRVPLHTRARQLKDAGRLRPIGDLLTTTGFRTVEADVTYPEAGSFMLVVRTTCGLDGIRRLFASGTSNDSATSVRAQFQTVCGRSIDDVELEWLGVIQSAADSGGQR